MNEIFYASMVYGLGSYISCRWPIINNNIALNALAMGVTFAGGAFLAQTIKALLSN